ncbi:MAG: Hsp20/alpha crystallin family protein [Bacteroidetes bacterium]|nr:Hsp20/alpha crystallin family protein [Bacteroidota bacterium]
MITVNKSKFWIPSMFDEFVPVNNLDSLNYERFSIPKVNIKENFTTFIVEIAAPGLKKEDFAIDIEKLVLKVSSNFTPKRETTGTDNDTQFTRKEFNYTSFTRSFTLPKKVNVESIDATYTDGVLTISLPKKEVKEEIKHMVEIS